MSTRLSEPPTRADTGDAGVRLLAAVGAALALYGYLVGLWIFQHGVHAPPLDWLRSSIGRPLGLGEDFGPLGVALLLTTAGYAAPRHLVRRYAAVAAAVSVAAGLLALGAPVWTSPPVVHPTAANYLCNVTFACAVLPHKALVVPLVWVALLALLGALAAAATALLPARLAALGPAAQLAAVWLVVALGAGTGPLSQLGAIASFYPAVVIGQLVRAQRAGAVPAWAAVALAAAGWGASAYAEHRYPALDNWWYPVPIAYAGLLVAVAAVYGGATAARWAAAAPARWLADRAWPLLLLQGAVGWPLVTWLSGRVPVAVALVPAITATGLAADLVHRALARLVPEGAP